MSYDFVIVGDGALHVSNQKAPRPISEAYVEACSQMQIHRTDDFNDGTNEKVRHWQTTIHHGTEKNGTRCTTAAAYLFPVMDQRPNLTVITKARTTKVLLEGKRAVGVEYRFGKQTQVDSQFKVHGMQGLGMADASVMPNVVSGNINAPTIMIGEKCAAMI